MNRDALKYLTSALSAFTDGEVDQELLVKWYIDEELDEDSFYILQEWVCDHTKPEFEWMTGIGILEAVHDLVKDAHENNNIKY